MKKRLSILLILALTLSVLTGCGGGKTDPAEEPTAAPTAEATAAPTAAPEDEEVPDAEETAEETAEAYAAFSEAVQHARTAIDPDTVIATVDGEPLPWELFYYYVANDLQEAYYYLGRIPEDFTEVLSGETTWQSYFTASALRQSVFLLEGDRRAADMGVELSEEQRATLDGTWDRVVADYGDEELLQADLRDACLDKDLFLRILESNMKITAVMNELYGANGEKLSDAEVVAWAAENGYVRTKHVLWSFLDEDGTALDDEAKAALREKLEDLVAELRTLVDDADALEARFDELMNSESADLGGLEGFPAGYTYSAGTMVPAFEDAAFALGDYELSDPVETDYGYHILLGLPLEPDGLTMDQDANTGEYMTLRQTAANELFNRQLVEWIDSAQVEWAEGYEDLDFNALFHGE